MTSTDERRSGWGHAARHDTIGGRRGMSARTVSTRLHMVGTQLLLGATCVLVFWLTWNVIGSIAQESTQSRAVGTIWAVVSTIFVFHDTAADRRQLLERRIAATLLAFALCELYLLVLPFSIWGLGVMVALSGIAATLIGRPGDAGTAAITTAVILIASSLTQPNLVLFQPLLRLIDTILGAGINVLVASGWARLVKNA